MNKINTRKELSEFYNSIKFQLISQELENSQIERDNLSLIVRLMANREIAKLPEICTGKDRAKLRAWTNLYNHDKGCLWRTGALRQFNIPQWVQMQVWNEYISIV